MSVTQRDDAIEYVRKNVAMFFRSAEPSARECSANLASDALLLGASEVSIVRSGSFWIVGANKDWLAHEKFNILELFRRLVPCPEGGVNSIRSEVVVGAFSDTIASVDADSIACFRGAVDEAAIRALFVQHRWVRAVVFSFPTT